MSWQQYEKIKHKTILPLLYSSGLRVGELIGLRVQDIVWDMGVQRRLRFKYMLTKILLQILKVHWMPSLKVKTL